MNEFFEEHQEISNQQINLEKEVKIKPGLN